MFSSITSLGQTCGLAGRVVNQDHLPLRFATLLFQGVDGSSSVKAKSDSLGRFSFSNLTLGRYKLAVSHAGYKQHQANIILDNKRTVLEIELIAEVKELKEITVQDHHAQIKKQEESLNTEIVKSDFMKRNLGGSLMKSLERLPGIKTIGIGSGQSKPLIRGLGFNRVAVVEKGVKHEGQEWGADHGLEIDQFAAGEVEVIKGAASFIYGSNAIGGAIDVNPQPIPAKNTLVSSADLITKSNNNLYGTSVNLNGRTDHWFFDTRVTRLNYSDYRVPTNTTYVYDYVVNLNDNYLRNTAGNETGLHFTTGYVSDRGRSVFYWSNSYSKSSFFANAHGLKPVRVDTDLHDASNRDVLLPYQEVNHFKVINRSEYYLPGNKLEMDVGYQRNFRQEYSKYVSHGSMPSKYPAGMPVSSDLELAFKKHTYSVNLRDHVSLRKHTLTTGVHAEHQDNDIGGWGFLIPAFKQDLTGAYIYDKFKLNDHVLIHGALRYDHGQIRVSKYTDWFAIDAQKITRAENLTRIFNSLVWSIGLNYNRDKFSLKTNIGKSFRMPLAKELAANGVNYHYFSYEKGNPTLSAEKSYQVDICLGWNDDKWSIQISPFYNYFPNYIYLNPTSIRDPYYGGAVNQVFKYTQSRVVRYGGELQFKYNLLKGLSTEVLGEYVLSRQLSGDKKGYSLPFSPPPSVLFNLTYSPQFNKGFTGTYFSVDYRITGRQNQIVPPEKRTEGYHLMNFQTGTKIKVSGQQIAFNLQVQNVLNKKYFDHTSFYRLIELPEAGRNVVLSIKVPIKIKGSE